MKSLATIFCIIVLVTLTTLCAAQEQTTSAPAAPPARPTYKTVKTLNGLNQQQEAYQIGVWTFIVFLVIGLLGFGTMASIDYSDDALLTSAPDGDSKSE